MSTIAFIGLLAGAWIIGVFGFAQIVGSLQNLFARPFLLFPLLLWSCILLGILLLVSRFLPKGAVLPVLIGYGISFLQILFSGRIE